MNYVVVPDNFFWLFFMLGCLFVATYGLAIAWLVSDNHNSRLHRFLRDQKLEQRYAEYSFVKEELKQKHKNW